MEASPVFNGTLFGATLSYWNSKRDALRPQVQIVCILKSKYHISHHTCFFARFLEPSSKVFQFKSPPDLLQLSWLCSSPRFWSSCVLCPKINLPVWYPGERHLNHWAQLILQEFKQHSSKSVFQRLVFCSSDFSPIVKEDLLPAWTQLRSIVASFPPWQNCRYSKGFILTLEIPRF